MKKILALLLVLIFMFSFVACSKTEQGDTTDDASSVVDTQSEQNTDDDSVAATLVNDFKEIAKDKNLTAEQIATKLSENSVIAFGPMVMAVEPGFLTGFVDYEVKGFSEGAIFSPMIGTIPFVSYVFKLDDGADVEAFKTSLTDNANLAWNICTQADQMMVESVDNTVFFVMSPLSFEE